MPVTTEQMHEIAEEVAERTVNKLFLALGVNTADPNEIPKFQKDLAHLRSWRESTEAIKRRGLLSAVTFIVTAALGWVAYGTWHGH